MAAGEEFSSRSAVTKARHTINQLDQLLDILK